MSNQRRGRRTFIAGAIGLLVFGSVHMIAIYKGLIVGPKTPDEIAIDNAERAFKILDVGPFHTTGWHTMNILSISFSALLLYTGVLNLLVMGPMMAAGRLRKLTAVNIVFVILLMAIILVFQFPPPALFAALTLLFFVWSWMRQGSANLSASS
jgi:hypothetical protein